LTKFINNLNKTYEYSTLIFFCVSKVSEGQGAGYLVVGHSRLQRAYFYLRIGLICLQSLLCHFSPLVLTPGAVLISFDDNFLNPVRVFYLAHGILWCVLIVSLSISLYCTTISLFLSLTLIMCLSRCLSLFPLVFAVLSFNLRRLRCI